MKKNNISANFPKNMPFDYVENVRASMASSVGTDFDERNINGGDFKIDLAAAQTVTTPGGRKHKNMPFDYVENVRASLASSMDPGRNPSPKLKLTSYAFIISQISSK